MRAAKTGPATAETAGTAGTVGTVGTVGTAGTAGTATSRADAATWVAAAQFGEEQGENDGGGVASDVVVRRNLFGDSVEDMDTLSVLHGALAAAGVVSVAQVAREGPRELRRTVCVALRGGGGPDTHTDTRTIQSDSKAAAAAADVDGVVGADIGPHSNKGAVGTTGERLQRSDEGCMSLIDARRLISRAVAHVRAMPPPLARSSSSSSSASETKTTHPHPPFDVGPSCLHDVRGQEPAVTTIAERDGGG